MKLPSRYLIAVLTIALFSQACTSSPNTRTAPRTVNDDKSDSLLLVYNPKKADQRIHNFMVDLHKKYGFNGNVLVAKKGKILYENSFGWADYLHRDSLNLSSQFELASISKTMTGTAIMMLVEDGKLRLDQNVKEFFPNFPYEGITVRLLLTHRSGMMNYVYFVDRLWKAAKKNEKKGISNQEVMGLIAEHKPAPYT